jgi:hypothetical protein
MAVVAETGRLDDPIAASPTEGGTALIASARAIAVLQALGITAAELLALQRQGFVSAERRGAQSQIYKLRFRLLGRQRVRYLGADPSAAAVIQGILRELQQDRRLRKQIRIACSNAAQTLRETKRQLEPLLELYGFKFHGQAIRRPRRTEKQPYSDS